MADLWNNDPFGTESDHERYWQEEEERIAQQLQYFRAAQTDMLMECISREELPLPVFEAPQWDAQKEAAQMQELDAYLDAEELPAPPTKQKEGKKSLLAFLPPRIRTAAAAAVTRWNAFDPRQHRALGIGGAAAAVLLLVLILVLALSGRAEVPRFPRNTVVNGIDISRCTYEEAETILRRQIDETYAGVVMTLSYAGGSWTLDAEQLGLGDDLAAVLDSAMERTRPTRFPDRIAECFRFSKQAREKETAIAVSETVLRSTLAEVCGIMDESVVEGSVEFDPSAIGEQGLFTITAPRTGRQIDMVRLVSDIRQAVFVGGVQQIVVHQNAVYPQKTLSELKWSVSSLAQSTGVLPSDPTEEKNARMAAKRLNGTQIASGETFSFHDCMGGYSGENGFEMVKNETGTYDVPGLSSTASALYRAALLSDMTVLFRCAPDLPMDYDAVGLEAAVGEGKDLVFRNDGAGTVYLYAAAADGKLTVAFYGTPDAREISVTVETEVLTYIEPEETAPLTDPENAYGLAPGEVKEVSPAYPGGTVRVWRIYTDKFLNVLDRVEISTDEYPPVPAVRVQGAG